MGRAIQLSLTGPDVYDDRVPPRITVDGSPGITTREPHAVLECGTEVELTLTDLQWLRDKGIPAAIQKLSELGAILP